MLDGNRMAEIKGKVAEAELKRFFTKDSREYYGIVSEYFEEVKASVFSNKHSEAAARLFIDLEQRRVELAAMLGEEIEQEE